MNAADKNEAFTILRDLGFSKVEVSFSGGNDEGGSDSISGLSATRFVQITEPERLIDLLEAPMYEEYGSFAGDFEVSGTVVWDVTALTVTMVRSEQVWAEAPSLEF